MNVPGFITLSSVSPEIVYITSPFGAELNALDTVTDVALKELIALVSILRSSDQKVWTTAPLSSFKLEAFAWVSIAAPSSSRSIKSPELYVTELIVAIGCAR